MNIIQLIKSWIGRYKTEATRRDNLRELQRWGYFPLTDEYTVKDTYGLVIWKKRNDALQKCEGLPMSDWDKLGLGLQEGDQIWVRSDNVDLHRCFVSEDIARPGLHNGTR